jgi:glyoxylase-like metal-dependent hydrolase (beta-lactamase superfamily II)
MKLYPVEAGFLKCDGGALFGVVPKVVWSKKYPVDENNMCTATTRCLLVDIGSNIILIDAGAGDKYDERYARNNGLHGDATLLGSLNDLGYKADDITDVIFSHLHWDHCGGSVVIGNDGKTPEVVFKNATHWVSSEQWKQACNPNMRDGSAYFEADRVALRESGSLKFIDGEGELFPGVEVRIFNGHTPGQIIPIIHYRGRKIVFTADLLTVAASIPVPWIAAYDLDPVTAMEEKQEFLNEVLSENMVLFFEHDKYTECIELKEGKKWPVVKNTFALNDLN